MRRAATPHWWVPARGHSPLVGTGAPASVAPSAFADCPSAFVDCRQLLAAQPWTQPGLRLVRGAGGGWAPGRDDGHVAPPLEHLAVEFRASLTIQGVGLQPAPLVKGR